MRIGFYNPYFDGFGGGERYTLTLASHWSQHHDVDIFWDDDSLKREALKRFEIDLSNIKIVHNIFYGGNVLKKLFLTRKYDIIFFLSDGSVPSTLARHNILHFQVPFPVIRARGLKLSRFDSIVCNSVFTKAHLDPHVGHRSIVIYPPVRTRDFKPKRKMKQVLSVGRFSSHYQAKKQQILIDVFRQCLQKKQLSDWRLVLAGGLLKSDKNFFETLQKQSGGLPVRLVPNAPYTALKELYAESSIYWHAAGFGESDPALAEHFGISSVEAMAAGSIPIVYNGGGQSEIVEDGKSGFLWRTTDELIRFTLAAISHKALYSSMQKECNERAKVFDESQFIRSFDGILDSFTNENI